MKNSKLTGKLSLKKETVARLNDAQMTEVKGGTLVIKLDQCNHSGSCIDPTWKDITNIKKKIIDIEKINVHYK